VPSTPPKAYAAAFALNSSGGEGSLEVAVDAGAVVGTAARAGGSFERFDGERDVALSGSDEWATPGSIAGDAGAPLARFALELVGAAGIDIETRAGCGTSAVCEAGATFGGTSASVNGVESSSVGVSDCAMKQTAPSASVASATKTGTRLRFRAQGGIVSTWGGHDRSLSIDTGATRSTGRAALGAVAGGGAVSAAGDGAGSGDLSTEGAVSPHDSSRSSRSWVERDAAAVGATRAIGVGGGSGIGIEGSRSLLGGLSGVGRGRGADATAGALGAGGLGAGGFGAGFGAGGLGGASGGRGSAARVSEGRGGGGRRGGV